MSKLSEFLTKEEQDQLKESKQLARAQGLSMTEWRGAGMWLMYRLHDMDFDYTFCGQLNDVLKELRSRKL